MVYKIQFKFKGNWAEDEKINWAGNAKKQIENAWNDKLKLIGSKEWEANSHLLCSPCVCFKKGFNIRVEIITIVDGWCWTEDNTATVIKNPSKDHRSWANTSTSELGEGDLLPRTDSLAYGQVTIAHEFGHMIGLSHPTPNNALGPNEILAYFTPDGQPTNVGTARDNIMGTGMKPRPSSGEQWRDFMDKEFKKCGPFKIK